MGESSGGGDRLLGPPPLPQGRSRCSVAARGARLTMDGRSVAVFAAAALLVACVALVARNDNPPSASRAVLLAKDAAHARLAALALRDEQRLAAGRDDTPSAIKKLDQVAQTVSLAEDDRIIEKAKKEVLSAQKQMKHMDLFKQATKAAPPTKQLRNSEPTVLQHPVETHSGGGMSRRLRSSSGLASRGARRCWRLARESMPAPRGMSFGRWLSQSASTRPWPRHRPALPHRSAASPSRSCLASARPRRS